MQGGNMPSNENSAVTFTYNHDVAGVHQRLNRFIEEMLKSASSSLSEFSEFDVVRLKTYLNAIRTYHKWVTAQPQLDLPETTPRKYDLKTNPVIPDLENESVKDVIRMLELGRDELVASQSSRKPSGMVTFDSARLEALIDKVDNFIADYIEVATPLDLPESSPQTAITGHGKNSI